MTQPRLSVEALRASAAKRGDHTDTEIARRIRRQQSTLSRLIAGQNVPSLPTLVALRAAYGISLDELVPADDAAEPETATT